MVPRLMLAIAASLVVMSAVHLGGALTGSSPFDPTDAGIAEATIAVVLAAGAVALLRGGQRAWSLAVAAVAFAIAGFCVGLSFTLRGGDAIDVAYHLTVLPLLVITLVVLLRRRPAAATPGAVVEGAAYSRR
jgi:hypothetical protein